jgi:hypothetical protein
MIRSPFLYIPGILLLASVGFAITGTMKLDDIRMDAQEIAERAVVRAREELKDYGNEAKSRIDVVTCLISSDQLFLEDGSV